MKRCVFRVYFSASHIMCANIRGTKSRDFVVQKEREWTRLGVGLTDSGSGIRHRILDGVVFAPIQVRLFLPAELVSSSR